MHAVLYTRQLEPITVIDLPMSLWSRLGRGEEITIPVMERYAFKRPGDPQFDAPMRLVRIFGEIFRRRDKETLMIFTGDEENAPLLKAEFLRGQRGELHKRARDAFGTCFLRALQDYED